MSSFGRKKKSKEEEKEKLAAKMKQQHEGKRKINFFFFFNGVTAAAFTQEIDDLRTANESTIFYNSLELLDCLNALTSTSISFVRTRQQRSGQDRPYITQIKTETDDFFLQFCTEKEKKKEIFYY
jgi:hypothetical protein